MNFIKQYFVLISLFLIISIVPVIFLDTTVSMINVWIVNETFTHGFLVLPITLWLIWQRRHRLLEIPTSPEPRVLILLLLSLSGWFISSVVGVYVTQQLSMVAVIISLVWIVLGRDVLKFISFPLFFLFFAVPLGQGLIPAMMEFTANFTIILIHLTGIPVYRDGLFFTLPTGSWSVVEECSGVRYLIASIALGTIYAYLNYSSLRKRLIFVLVSIIVPVFANGFRAFMIVMIGHLSGMKLAVGADHLLYGWVFFGIVIFILFYIGSFWWDDIDDTSHTATFKVNHENFKFSTSLITVSLVLALATQLFALNVKDKEGDKLQTISLNIPGSFNAWQYDPDRSVNWKPIIKSTDVTISKGYRFGDDLVQLDIGYYQQQNQNAEAVSSENKLTDPYDGDWKLTSQSDFQLNEMYVSEVEVRYVDSKVLVWQWYRLGKLQTPNPYIAKIFDAFNIITSNRSDAAYITVSTPLTDNKGISRKRLSDFLENALDVINTQLEKASGHNS